MMWKKLWTFRFHGKKTTKPRQPEERKPMTAAIQEPICCQEENSPKAPAEEEKPALQAEKKVRALTEEEKRRAAYTPEIVQVI